MEVCWVGLVAHIGDNVRPQVAKTVEGTKTKMNKTTGSNHKVRSEEIQPAAEGTLEKFAQTSKERRRHDSCSEVLSLGVCWNSGSLQYNAVIPTM